jgi:hypothetical protein
MYPRPAVAASWLDRLLTPIDGTHVDGGYPAQPVAQPRAPDLRSPERWQDDPALVRYRRTLDPDTLAYQASAGRVCGCRSAGWPSTTSSPALRAPHATGLRQYRRCPSCCRYSSRRGRSASRRR